MILQHWLSSATTVGKAHKNLHISYVPVPTIQLKFGIIFIKRLFSDGITAFFLINSPHYEPAGNRSLNDLIAKPPSLQNAIAAFVHSF